MDRIKLLLELLAVAAVSASAGASKPGTLPPDGGMSQLVRSNADGGMTTPRETQVALRSISDGGY
jgi:hypothetical protein